MKKYLIAGVVAVSLTMVTAFAANLNVNGGTLQAGTDDVLTCTEDAVVTWPTHVAGDGQFHVDKVVVTFDDASCAGNFAYLSILKSPTTQVGFGIKAIAGNSVTFEVNEGNANSLVEGIERVSVMVKSSDDSGVGGFFNGIVQS